jgi:penicillin-binding protein 1C
LLRRALWSGLAAVIMAVAGIGVLWVGFPFDRSPLYQIPAGVTWSDRDGVPLRVRLADGGFDSVPGYGYRHDDWIAKAVVAAEDRRFWSHPGVDPLAVVRSCKQTASAMRRISGASTLSMQLIRMSSPHPRTLSNKTIEAFRALQMERQIGKEEILSLYLNRAPFGANVIGIEAAARRYFAKGAHDLTLAEASLLAGIPQSPTRFHPVRHADAAMRRQAYVLARMVATKMITREQMDHSLALPLRIQPNHYPFHAPHFCDMLARQSVAGATGVPTTLDLDLQLTAEESLAKLVPGLAVDGIRGAAVVVLDVRTGGIRALIGSPDFRAHVRGAQVNAALARRSAGSTLKPFVYAMAFERGTHTPLSALYDVPERFSDYDPVNFDKGYRGVVTLRDALVQSLNLPAIEVEREVGQPAFHARLRELGLRTLTRPAEDYGLGLVLGNAEVTLLDLTNAYACLARGGIYQPWRTTPAQGGQAALTGGTPNTASLAGGQASRLSWPTGFQPVVSLADRRDALSALTGGTPVLQSTSAKLTLLGGTPVLLSKGTRVFSEETCWLISDMLGGDERAMRSTGTVADIRLARFAWKTGTSSGFRDAWTVAYNPEYAIGVWLGNPDGRASPALVGMKVAAPLVWEIIRRLYPDGNGPWFAKPGAVETREVCAASGQTPCPNCPKTVHDHAIGNVSRYQTCEVHRFSREAVWPPRVAGFLRSRGDAGSMAANTGLTITSPADGSTYLYVRDANPRGGQRIPLTATAGDSSATLHWFVNDAYIGGSRSGGTVFWDLRTGTHRVVCSDSSGASRSIRIVVKEPRGALLGRRE